MGRADLVSLHAVWKSRSLARAETRIGGPLHRHAPLGVQPLKLRFQAIRNTDHPILGLWPSFGRRRATHEMLRQWSGRYGDWHCENQTPGSDVKHRVLPT
jgi:hypothetical protein